MAWFISKAKEVASSSSKSSGRPNCAASSLRPPALALTASQLRVSPSAGSAGRSSAIARPAFCRAMPCTVADTSDAPKKKPLTASLRPATSTSMSWRESTTVPEAVSMSPRAKLMVPLTSKTEPLRSSVKLVAFAVGLITTGVWLQSTTLVLAVPAALKPRPILSCRPKLVPLKLRPRACVPSTVRLSAWASSVSQLRASSASTGVARAMPRDKPVSSRPRAAASLPVAKRALMPVPPMTSTRLWTVLATPPCACSATSTVGLRSKRFVAESTCSISTSRPAIEPVNRTSKSVRACWLRKKLADSGSDTPSSNAPAKPPCLAVNLMKAPSTTALTEALLSASRLALSWRARLCATW